MTNIITSTKELDFLHDYALDKERFLTESEKETVELARTMLHDMDELFVCLGGRANRLGECVVATGLLEGILQAICYLAKDGIPVYILVDAGSHALFNEHQYQTHYWSDIHCIAITDPADIQATTARHSSGQRTLIVDLHGAHDGMPYIETQIETLPNEEQGWTTTLGRLFRVGMRSYAHRGPKRRYADFIEDLFALPCDSIDGRYAQPTLRLSPSDNSRYQALMNELDLNSEALQIVCFFQSVVLAKCYERWEEVMLPLCQYIAEHFPQQKIDFLIACGPDEEGIPESVTKAALEEEFKHFTGVNHNTRVLVRSTPSLRDLSILINNADLVLSNDTGPGHIAGALKTPTVTPYMPGNVYSKRVWSSTLWHHGVTLEPNPYSFRQLESAVLWGNTEIINSVPPEDLQQEVLKCLPAKLQLA
jgi:Glycosyltransferase family 9 (heptosyltransferase)